MTSTSLVTAVRRWAHLVSRAFAVAMVLCVGFWLLEPVDASAQAVVDKITFQARVTYRYGSVPVTQLFSNPVDVGVAELHRLALHGAGSQFGSPGGQAVFPLTVINAGNVVDSFALQATVEGKAFDVRWYYSPSVYPAPGTEWQPVAIDAQSALPRVGPLPPGASIPLLAVVAIPAEADYGVSMLAVNGVSTADPTATASITMPLHVANGVPYLEIAEASAHVYAGSDYELQLAFGNRGAEPLTNITLSLQLPPQANFIAAALDGEYDGTSHTVQWDIGSIAPDEAFKVKVQLRASEEHGPAASLEHVALLQQVGATLLQDAVSIELATHAPSRLTVTANPTLLRADGVSRSTITAQVVDSVGAPVEDGTLITFHTPRGTWQATTGALPCGALEPGSCMMVPTYGGIAQAELLGEECETAEFTVVPITVSAPNPYYGQVTAQVDVYFASGAIVGRIFDHATGFPDSGTEVRLTRLDSNGRPSSESIVQHTDERGYYIFSVSEGDYAISVLRNTDSGMSEIQIPPIRVNAASGAVTYAPRMILGRLVDGITGQGVSAAVVELVGPENEPLASVQTDENGNYALILDGGETVAGSDAGRLLASNHAPLTNVLAPGSRFDNGRIIRARTSDGRGADSLVRDVLPGELFINFNLRVEPLGKVIDAVTGRPIPGAEVSVLWASSPWEDEPVALPPLLNREQPNPAITDATGTYQFEVEPGYYRLQVVAPGYRTLRTDPFLTHGDRLARELAITPLGTELLRIEKRATPVYSQPGDRVTFTVIVQNLTDRRLNDIEVMALLPDGLSPIVEDHQVLSNMVVDVSTISWELESLSPREPVILGYEATIGEGLAGKELVSHANARLRDSDGFAMSSVTLRIGDWPALHLDTEAPSQADIGDIIAYRIHLKNTSDDITTMNTTIETHLPQGFHYIEGSAHVDGVGGIDPIANEDQLVWEIGAMEPGVERSLVYRAAVGLDSMQSDGVHMARASGEVLDGHIFQTEWDVKQTQVGNELFGADGRIFGRVVVVDQPEDEEHGNMRLDGISILLDDGRQTTTDAQGMFAFDAVAPGVRSIKIIEVSLMPGTTIAHFADGDFVGEPARRGGWSRFVDVRPNTTAFVTVHLTDEGATSEAQSAYVSSQAEHDSIQVEATQHNSSEQTDIADWRTLAFISPEAGSALHGRLTTVIVESRLNDSIELWVNGEMVPESQIGEWLEDPAQNVQRRTYYNVPLQAGPNVLTLIADDDHVEQTVFAVGSPANIELVAVPSVVPYREVRDIPIELLVTDRHGFPVADGTVVTLDVLGAEVVEPDLYPEQPGFQARTRNGRVVVTLRVNDTPQEAVRIQFNVADGTHAVELPTHFLPAPLLLAGLIDLRMPLNSDASPSLDGSVIYSQGFANGSTLVARYDTRRTWYPLHDVTQPVGAGTVDRTPSADPLYIRYESEHGYVLYGDYSPAIGVASRYTQRRGGVTGLHTAWEGTAGQFGMYAFAHRGQQHSEIFPLNSVLGTFDLAHSPILVGTEEVWLVRKDALLDIEVGREQLLRGRDYEFNHVLGLLRVKNLFPSSVRMGERLFVEVVYATPMYGGSGTAFGLQIAALPIGNGQTPALTVTWAADRRGNDQANVVGINGQIHSEAAGLRLSYDMAADIQSGVTDGLAANAADGTAGELRLQWQRFNVLQFDVRHQWVDGQFVRPGSDMPLTEERRTIGTVRLTLSEFSRAELVRAMTSSAKDGVAYRDELRLWQDLSPKLQAHLGLRSSGTSSYPLGAKRQWTATAGTDWQLSDRSYLELSQEVDLPSGHADTFGWGQSILRYAHTWNSGVVTSIQFASGGTTAPGGWTLAAEASPEAGPSMYGNFQWLEDQVLADGKSVVGLADEWEPVPGLHLGLSAESTSELNDVEERIWGVSGAWQAEYFFASEQSVGIEQQLSRREGREQRSLRLWASGAAMPGLRHGIEVTWLSGDVHRATADPIKRLVEGEVSYREPLADRFFGAARYVHREYEILGTTSTPLSQKSSSVWFIEGGLRPTTDTTWYVHWAQKRSTAQAAANHPSFTIALRQIGFQKQLHDRWGIDLFMRHLNDSGGTSLHGGGFEVVYGLTPDLGIGLGYSSLGVNDPDLYNVAAWPEGWYLRLRMKF